MLSPIRRLRALRNSASEAVASTPPDASFDVIYAASLFTHLLPDETRNYFCETRRVLKPTGRCLFSFFHLDHYGAGGEARQPLGLAVVGGLLFSQLVTLYLTPVVYTYRAGLQEWLGRRATREVPAAVHSEV